MALTARTYDLWNAWYVDKNRPDLSRHVYTDASNFANEEREAWTVMRHEDAHFTRVIDRRGR